MFPVVLVVAEVAAETVYNHSMPKRTGFPKLRAHRWVERSGAEKVYYYYDMRGSGRPDIALGPDREEALQKWSDLQQGRHVKPWERPKVVKPPKAKLVRRLGPRVAGKRRAFDANTWDGMPAWAKRMYLGAETRSAERGRGEFLTIKQFRDIVARADGKCELTGLKLDVREDAGRRRPLMPSIDRIDASRGYIVGNVRIICLLANQALSEWGEEPVFAVAEAIMRKNTSATASATTADG